MNRVSLIVILAGIICVGGLKTHAAPPKAPDFTNGDVIPKGWDHDWNLGATGARGWMHSDKLATTSARQIRITTVDENSPADGVLAVGDVILGVAGKDFSYDPRTEFGKALTAAESDAGGGRLSLTRWRDSKIETVHLKLPVLGTYSATAPYDCPKSRRILERGCKALAKNITAPKYKPHSIVRSLNALALLASGDPQYLPLVKKEAEHAAAYNSTHRQGWTHGYLTLFLAEYVMATGDKSVLPGLRRLALETANGQSLVGSWGHSFVGEDGRLGGYGMMNSPGIPLTIGLVLAREAGVNDTKIDVAIERSTKLLRFYIGKGSIPYGDHAPWTQAHDDNGKNGMATVLFDALGERGGAEYFSRMSVASHSSERDTGHTGNFFNITWAMPGVARSGPRATGAWMNEYGSWYFDLARKWDGAFVHQGPPDDRRDKYKSWDCTGAYLLAYAMPLKKIRLTGKRPSVAPQVDAAAARGLIDDGRGWSNENRNEFYDSLERDELLKRLASWSPIVRGRAAEAVGRKGKVGLIDLLKMLGSPDVNAQLGACKAIAKMKAKAPLAVPVLQKMLKHDEVWVRIKAAEALGSIGEAGMAALPELLQMVAQEPTADDPRGMQQRYLSFVVFNKMLRRSLDGVDPQLLRRAVVAGLKNEDGRARGAVGGVYQRLNYDHIQQLLPTIHEAIVEPAPSGIMFADQVRIAGLALLAKHKIAEGVTLAADLIEPERWGAGNRMKSCLRILEQYGGAAKPVIPKLREIDKTITGTYRERHMQAELKRLRELIEKIEKATDAPKLRRLRG